MSYLPTFLAYNHSISPPPGSIMAYLGKNTPDGWLPCDGNTYTLSNNDNSFQYLAPILNAFNNTNTNTSNSVTTPNLQSKFLWGSSTYNSLTYDVNGSQTQTLNISNLPAHNHNFNVGGTQYYIYRDTKGNIPDTGGTDYVRSTTSSSQTSQIVTSNTGSATAFSIMPPYFTINYIIKY